MASETKLTGLRTYIYECTECESGRFELLVRYPDRDEQVCEDCGNTLTRRPSACTVNTRISRTFVDGTDRGSDYNKCKEAGKIEAEMFDLPLEKRDAHQKEITKLRKVKK